MGVDQDLTFYEEIKKGPLDRDPSRISDNTQVSLVSWLQAHD